MARFTEQEFAEYVERFDSVWEAVTEGNVTSTDLPPGALRDYLENMEPLIAETVTELSGLEHFLSTLVEPDED